MLTITNCITVHRYKFFFFFHCYSNRPGKNGEIETNECQKFISKIDDDDDDNDDDGGCRNVGNDNEYYE